MGQVIIFFRIGHVRNESKRTCLLARHREALFFISSLFSSLFTMTFAYNECQKCVLLVASKKSLDDSVATRCVGTAARRTSIVGPRALKERENEGAASHGALAVPAWVSTRGGLNLTGYAARSDVYTYTHTYRVVQSTLPPEITRAFNSERWLDTVQ